MLNPKHIMAFTAVLCALSVSAVFASPASAAEFELTHSKCIESSFTNLCYEEIGGEVCSELTVKLCELRGEQTIKITSGETRVVIPPFEFLCKKDKGVGLILQANPLVERWRYVAVFIIYEECLLVGSIEIAEKCTMPEKVETKELEVEGEETETLDLVLPTTGTTFAEFEIKSKTGATCPATVIGKHTITGDDELLVKEPGTLKEAEEGEAIAKGGLKSGGKEIELTDPFTIRFEPFSGDEWYLSNLA